MASCIESTNRNMYKTQWSQGQGKLILSNSINLTSCNKLTSEKIVCLFFCSFFQQSEY